MPPGISIGVGAATGAEVGKVRDVRPPSRDTDEEGARGSDDFASVKGEELASFSVPLPREGLASRERGAPDKEDREGDGEGDGARGAPDKEDREGDGEGDGARGAPDKRDGARGAADKGDGDEEREREGARGAPDNGAREGDGEREGVRSAAARDAESEGEGEGEGGEEDATSAGKADVAGTSAAIARGNMVRSPSI